MVSSAIYLQFVRLSFLKMMAYRLRYYTGIVTYLVHVSVYWFIWEAVYKGRGEIGGFSLTEMTTYVAVGWIARSFYFNNIDWEIQSRVHSGDISLDLIRPTDFQGMQLSTAVGESLFRLILFALPAGIVICLVFPVMPPIHPQAAFGFMLATLIAFLINAQVNFLIGLLSFKTRSVMGIMRAKYVVMQILTGLTVPISFYPEWLQQLFYLTPFPYIANVPLSIYLGKITNQDLLHALGIQSLWVIALFLLGRWFWSANLKRLVIQGG